VELMEYTEKSWIKNDETVRSENNKKVEKRNKLTKEMLEDAKKWYLEGNFIKKVTELLKEKYGIKIGKSTVEHHLSKIIKLRSKRDVMALKRGNYLDESRIIELYTVNKMSLNQIAELFNASNNGIKWALLKNGVKLRNKLEGLRIRIGKYKKPPFNRNKEDKAYLIGITLGDLHVRKRNSKFTIEVNTTTTHEEMAKLLVDVFRNHTDGIVCYPDNKKGFRFYAYLDNSFDFLIEAKNNLESIKNFDNEEFLSFLAGFFDAEGCIVKRKDKKSLRYLIKIGNTNKQILEIIKEKLKEFGIHANLYKYCDKEKYFHKKNYYALEIGRKKDVINFLRLVNMKHPEKIERKKEALEFYCS
jgi:intein-encoded DNA endonuclease-like protein